MQTFLPYDDFTRSAQSLDTVRLRKQVIECKQIMAGILDGAYLRVNGVDVLYSDGGYPNHPCVNMWRGHPLYLSFYTVACIREVWRRGNPHSYKTIDHMMQEIQTSVLLEENPPHWLGNSDLHLSHQSNLIRKDPEYYGPQFPDVPNDLPYVWPQ